MTDDTLASPCLSLLSPDEFPERSLGFQMWHALSSWKRVMDGQLEQLGLTHTLFVLLMGVSRMRAAGMCPSQARLAEVLRYDPMLVSKGLRSLEKAGLLERRTHPDDPRAKELLLSATGDKVLAEARALVEAAHDKHFALLGDAIHPFRACLRALNGLGTVPRWKLD